MKVFYIILLSIGLLSIKADWQPGAAGSSRADSVILAHPDSAVSIAPAVIESSGDAKKLDSTASNKESLLFGVASFYSRSLEGTETSTGEIFTHKKYTAASNHLKLNSWVKVTNLRNGKTVVVRINDRMHKNMSRKGRVVDLSIAAAKKIGLNSLIGITKVKVEKIPPPLHPQE